MVKNFIIKAYPDYQNRKLIDQEHSNIEEFDDIFKNLFLIHKHRYKYDLHRALKEADKKFEIIINRIFKQQLKPRLKSIMKNLKESIDKVEIDKYSENLFKTAHKKEKNFRRKAKFLSILGVLVSLIDIIISVILIVAISMISHRGDTRINSVILGILFIVIIALLKVTLDRFWIIPNVHKLWRNMYINSIKKLKSDIAKFEAISLVIICSISKNDHSITTIDLIKRGINHMNEE